MRRYHQQTIGRQQFTIEQGHDSISGHLIDRPLVIMDLVDENLVDFVHHGIDFFRAQFLRQGGKALHVTKHHGDLLVFSFYFTPLR